MVVNRYQNHLVVYLEDRPYREMINGAKSLPQFNHQAIDVKTPCGGWKKVFDELEDNLPFIDGNKHMHVLLLMDFDNDFPSRRDRLEKLCQGHAGAERIFMLGIDQKESEDLKRTLKQSNHEAIGKILLQDCPCECFPHVWRNQHLDINQAEIERMRSAGVLQWIFENNFKNLN